MICLFENVKNDTPCEVSFLTLLVGLALQLRCIIVCSFGKLGRGLCVLGSKVLRPMD